MKGNGKYIYSSEARAMISYTLLAAFFILFDVIFLVLNQSPFLKLLPQEKKDAIKSNNFL